MALFGVVLVGCSVFQTVVFATTYTVTIRNDSDLTMACQIFPKEGAWVGETKKVRTFPKEALTQYVGTKVSLNYSMDSDPQAPSDIVSKAMDSMYVSCKKHGGSVFGKLEKVRSGSKLIWQDDTLKYDTQT